ncbi:MAG: dephospho-CoA kinase [Thermoanaerobaculia bacterium]|nr:dephospho-CoA kinase [Thermoanaerobaculia bacterium]
MILRVGLTGGIASGKSTVASILGELGCVVIDADGVVRDLYRPGMAGHRALVGRYGDAVLRDDGEIDRPRLSAIALATPEGASELNALIHPLVIEEQERRIRAADIGRDTIVVVEATLLLESGGRQRFDRIVVVDLDPEEQVRRGTARGMSEEEVRLRMSRQMPREWRAAQADYVLSSAGTIHETRARTEALFDSLLADLERKK